VSEIELEQELLLLGEAFREIREQHGLSAAELSGAAGVEEARIADLEAGRLDADYDLLITLAEGIGVCVSAFFVRAEELGAVASE
jgi:transcriptional regulator with XRE-family HTH domain